MISRLLLMRLLPVFEYNSDLEIVETLNPLVAAATYSKLLQNLLHVIPLR